MDVTKRKSWLGLAMVLLALAVAIVAKGYQNQTYVAVWMYIATIVLFAVGGPMALNLSAKHLFNRAVQSYTLSRDKLMIHYDCSLPVRLVGPIGKAVLAVVENSEFGRVLWIRDEDSEGLDVLVISGKFKNIEFLSGTLSITRQARAGYRIEWPKDEVWKIE